MMMRRRRGGVMRTVATTAVIAGTATAVSGAVAGHQQTKRADQAQDAAAEQAAFDSQAQIQDMQAQMAAMQAQQVQAAVPAAPVPAAGGNMMAQLQQLAQLKEAGALSDEEFAAAKAKLLGM